MLSKFIRLSDLQVLLDKTLGPGKWINLEPETILLELGGEADLLLDKLFVLQSLNKALNSIISLPEFLLWTTSVCNNEYPEFETINMPTCLELAWTLTEIKKIGFMTGQIFSPSEELIDVVSYLLRQEGFSKPVGPFEFVPEAKLEQGQTKEDTAMKKKAIEAYIAHMEQGDGSK